MNIDLLPERIASRIKPEPMSGCWVWIAAHNNYGYGSVRVGSKSWLAHRVVYELLVGPIPEGLTIDHLCRNRTCVNPAHLEAVTPLVNIQRGLVGKQTHCPQGHLYSEENTYIKPPGWRECRLCRSGQRKKAAS